MFPLCTVSWYLQTTGASPVILVRLDHQQITALAAWWHDGAPARILLCKIMVRPARPRSYLRRWRPWRQCILWVTAGMYASMFVYNMYSIHVTVWTRVLFYISVVKNNFLAKKKKSEVKIWKFILECPSASTTSKMAIPNILKIAFLTMVWVHFLKYWLSIGGHFIVLHTTKLLS